MRRHQSTVFSIALHFLADRSAAEELAQDVFLQLHANLATMKSEDHMKFWLRKVTAHRCIDYKRRRKLPQVSLDDAPEPAAPTQSSDPFLARRLRQYVASLPEKPRLVVILRYQEDMRAEDIAEVLAMPLATVKSHLQRSLAMLREKVTRAIGEVTTMTDMNMNKDTNGLDDALKSALRRQEAPDGFADRVMARVAAHAGQTQEARRDSWLSLFTQPFVRWTALAAFATAMILGVHVYNVHREQARGEAAKQRLMLALHVAGSKLQLAKAKVNEMNANQTGTSR